MLRHVRSTFRPTLLRSQRPACKRWPPCAAAGRRHHPAESYNGTELISLRCQVTIFKESRDLLPSQELAPLGACLDRAGKAILHLLCCGPCRQRRHEGDGTDPLLNSR